MRATAAVSSTPDWAAYVCTDQGADLARTAFGRMGVGDAALRGGGLSGAARVSGETPVARRVLAEMGNLPVEMACEGVAEIRGSGAEVIVLGHDASLGTYRALRRAGALDYFAFPVSVEDIVALRSGAGAEATPTPATPVIGVVGSNGGVGASLLAQNLAFHASRARGPGLRVALVDGDLRFGSQALDLDVMETPGLIEALAAPDRVDATFLAATMTALSERLSLYACQVGAEQDVAALEAALPRLAAPLGAQFEAVVIDLPRATLLAQPGLAAMLVVVPPGYCGVNAAGRLMARVSGAAPDVRLLPVVSELRRDAGLSRKDMAQGLGVAPAAVLPRADGPMGRAHRAGKALVDMEPRSAYGRAVSGLWQAALGGAPERRRFPRLWGAA